MPITMNGTTGIVTPAIDAAAGNSALTTLSVGGNNISAVNSLGFRNRLINGDCRIDQRNAGASVTANDGTFVVDRFGNAMSQASKFTAQRNQGSITPPAGFTNYLGYTSSSAYSITATDFFTPFQVIEGFNIADLGWGTASAQSVTLSFWARSSLTGTFGGALSNAGLTRSYPFTYSINAANTWEYKTITIAGDQSGTWVTDNTQGIRLYFGLGVGSTYSGTAGAWAGARFQSATGATSVVGTNGATFYITGVQLEAGTVASPFERRDYGRELMMCQRYFAKTFDQSVAVSASTGSRAGSIPFFFWTTASTNAETAWQLPVEMRASPTVTSYAWTGGSANWANNAGGTVGIGTLRSGTRNVGLTVGGSVGASEQFWIHATVSAEL